MKYIAQSLAMVTLTIIVGCSNSPTENISATSSNSNASSSLSCYIPDAFKTRGASITHSASLVKVVDSNEYVSKYSTCISFDGYFQYLFESKDTTILDTVEIELMEQPGIISDPVIEVENVDCGNYVKIYSVAVSNELTMYSNKCFTGWTSSTVSNVVSNGSYGIGSVDSTNEKYIAIVGLDHDINIQLFDSSTNSWTIPRKLFTELNLEKDAKSLSFMHMCSKNSKYELSLSYYDLNQKKWLIHAYDSLGWKERE